MKTSNVLTALAAVRNLTATHVGFPDDFMSLEVPLRDRAKALSRDKVLKVVKSRKERDFLLSVLPLRAAALSEEHNNTVNCVLDAVDQLAKELREE